MQADQTGRGLGADGDHVVRGPGADERGEGQNQGEMLGGIGEHEIRARIAGGARRHQQQQVMSPPRRNMFDNVKLTIPVFSGRNTDWITWSAKFKAVGRQLGFTEALTEMEPDADAPIDDLERYTRSQGDAYSMLILHVEGDALKVVTKAQDGRAAEAWYLLEEKYQSGNATRKYLLQLQMFDGTNVHQDGGDLDGYLDKMDSLSRQLRDVGVDISDEIVIGAIARGLPPSFDNMSTENEGNLSAYIDKVKAHDQRMKLRRLKPETALKATTSGCFKCGKPGHRAFECKGKPKVTSKASYKFGGECFHCHEKGHMKTDCPKLATSRANVAVTKGPTTTTGQQYVFMGAKKTMFPDWIVDSGATQHVSPVKEDFYVLDSSFRSEICVASGEKEFAQGKGRIKLMAVNGTNGEVTPIDLEAWYVPSFATRLLSVSSIRAKGFHVKFDEKPHILCPRSGAKFMMRSDGGTFFLQCTREESAMAVGGPVVAEKLWHCRLGHAHHERVKSIGTAVEDFALGGDIEEYVCEACVMGKSHRASQPTSPATRSTVRGAVFFADLCGPMDTPSAGGNKYACVFVDDFSRKRFVSFIKTKDQALEKWKECVCAVEASGAVVRRLHSDNGGEFVSKTFKDYCTSKGIVQTFSAPYSPAQNGVAERSWRSLVESTRAMMLHSGVPKNLWSAAMSTAAHIIDRLPTEANNGKTPLELWTGKKPSVGHLRTFGCQAFVHVETHRKKLDAKARKGVFAGYDEQSRSYRVYYPEDGVFINSRSVDFDESCLPYMKTAKTVESTEPTEPTEILKLFPSKETQVEVNDLESEDVIVVPVVPDEEHQEDTTVSEGTRSEQSNKETESTESDKDEEALDEEIPVITTKPGVLTVAKKSARQGASTYQHKVLGKETIMSAMYRPREPATFDEAMTCEDADKWRAAMSEEITALEKMGTWELVKQPQGRKLVTNKWIYKVKFKSDGSVLKFKARLVARGFSQVEGIDYQETFAPVARFTTFRVLLSLATARGWILEQSDISNAFLHANLTEEIYMEQPKGFEKGGGKVCRLRKGLYGLKQCPREWNSVINDFLRDYGFTQSVTDPCLYHLKRDGSEMALVLYVDDLVYGSSSQGMIEKFKKALEQKFKVVHLGALNWYLGIEIVRKGETTFINQRKYVEDLLVKFNLEGCNPAKNPYSKLDQSMEPKTERVKSSSGEPWGSTTSRPQPPAPLSSRDADQRKTASRPYASAKAVASNCAIITCSDHVDW